MKVFRKIIALMILMNMCFSLNNIFIIANTNEDIYYQDEILETNNLPGGIKHTKIKGYSKVTNAELIETEAKEAGYGSTKPLILNQYYSQQLNILEIPNESKTKLIPWGVVNNGTWTLARVAAMAEDYEISNPGWKVVAAINGDFFDINGNNNLRYTPSGTMMVDGDLYKVSTSWPMLGINNSGEGNKLVGVWRNTVSTSRNPYLYIYDENDNIIKEFEINYINTTPDDQKISVYFTMFSSEHTPISQEIKDAYIVEKAIDTVAFSKGSLFGKGYISKVGNHKLTQNQFAISTNNEEVKSYLQEGVKIRVQYKILSEQLQQCDEIIGYHDNVIVDGIPCYENDGYGTARLPRTLIGTKADGSIIMIVVDGRQASSGYYGICSEETGAIVSYYGMVNGFQMDGGGSATMVVLKDGQLQVVNSPSDSNGATARSDSDCILVAMQVPTIEYQVMSKYNSIEFTIDVVEMIEEYKELYIDINGIKKPIVNGKVIFDNLNSYTNYLYEFYSKVDGEYVSIVYQGNIMTLKQTPILESLSVNIITIDGVDKYEITCNINDPDNSITYVVLKINNKKYWISGDKIYYSIENENIGIAQSWSIEFNYNLQGNTGMKKVEINDASIYFASVKAALDCQIDSINKNMLDIFVN